MHCYIAQLLLHIDTQLHSVDIVWNRIM